MLIEDRVKEFNESTFVKKSYSVEEVAQILGVIRQTVYKLINDKCFKAVKVGNQYRIIKESFDKWLDNE